MHGTPYDGDEDDLTPSELNTVMIVGNRLYRHNAVRINYTSYDVRHCQDSLNAHSHADIMVGSHEEAQHNNHPYWYGCIVTAFHADIFTLDRIQSVMNHSIWNFCGFTGMVGIWHLVRDGKQTDSIVLGLFRSKIPTRLDFSTQRKSFEVCILFWLFNMARLQSYYLHQLDDLRLSFDSQKLNMKQTNVLF